MSARADELRIWPDALQSAIDQQAGPLTRVIVLAETDSTQAAARRLSGRVGDLIVAGRQTAGRGRLGRTWIDERGEGVAMTAVMPREAGERLSLVGAVAAARAVEACLERRAAIKWPNDVLVDDRKVAGVLIEQANEIALLGIGINVRQMRWPDDLAGRAASLHEMGAAADRLTVMRHVIGELGAAHAMDAAALREAFTARDLLIGRPVTFRSGGEEVTGEVIDIDPLEGISVRTEGGVRRLDASTTSVLRVGPAGP